MKRGVAVGTREMLGGPNGWLLVHHEHQCTGCRTRYRCTAPECADVPARLCIACRCDDIEAKERAIRAKLAAQQTRQRRFF